MKFFRIITSDITAETSLKLPNKFVERHGAQVPCSVLLQAPNGAKWRVEVKKKEDEMWLGNGLFKFAESLGIEYGHFLVFDYDVDHAVFLMVVIGMNAAEIEYPAFNFSHEGREGEGGPHGEWAGKRPKVKEENGEDVDKNDNANMGCNRGYKDQSPLCDSARKKARASCFRNRLREKINENRSIESVAEIVQTDHATVMRGRFGREIILNNEGRIWCLVQGSIVNQNCAQVEKALKKAREFKAEEPFCTIVLSHSYVWQWQECEGSVRKKCQLLFPRSFAKEYFNVRLEDVTLRTDRGQTWTVKLLVAKDSKHNFFFTSGWKQFAVDNDLKAGDVCVFELIKGAANALKVVIFRVSDEDEAS